MFIERNPRRVAEDLHAATGIACSAFARDGRLLYAGGSHFPHDDYDLYHELVTAMIHPGPASVQTARVRTPQGRQFIAYYINKYKYDDGFILLGPYTEADLVKVSQFDICFYSNQTPDPVGARLLHRQPDSRTAICSLTSVRRSISSMTTTGMS